MMTKFLKDFSSHVLAFIFGVVFMQIPAFFNVYQQRLAGHVAELHFQLGQLEKLAILSNKNLEAYIFKFISQTDPDIQNQGFFMQDLLLRYRNLQQLLSEFQNSPIFLKPYFFLKNLQFSIAKESIQDFNMSIPLSLEGLSYAFLGIIVGFIIFSFLVFLITLPMRDNYVSNRR